MTSGNRVKSAVEVSATQRWRIKKCILEILEFLLRMTLMMRRLMMIMKIAKLPSMLIFMVWSGAETFVQLEDKLRLLFWEWIVGERVLGWMERAIRLVVVIGLGVLFEQADGMFDVLK